MSLFLQGQLEMSSTPFTDQSQILGWGDVATNQIAIVISGVIALLMLPDMLMVIGGLLDGLIFERSAEKLEHSLTMARIRNHMAFFFTLPLVMIVDRYMLYNPPFVSALPQWLRLPGLFVIMMVFILFRDLTYRIFCPSDLDHEEKSTLHHGPSNYFIALVLLMLLTSLVLSFFNDTNHIFKYFFYGEMALAYLLSLGRTCHFLTQRCGVFSTILYLCALELVPMAILIASATVVV